MGNQGNQIPGVLIESYIQRFVEEFLETKPEGSVDIEKLTRKVSLFFQTREINVTTLGMDEIFIHISYIYSFYLFFNFTTLRVGKELLAWIYKQSKELINLLTINTITFFRNSPFSKSTYYTYTSGKTGRIIAKEFLGKTTSSYLLAQVVHQGGEIPLYVLNNEEIVFLLLFTKDLPVSGKFTSYRVIAEAMGIDQASGFRIMNNILIKLGILDENKYVNTRIPAEKALLKLYEHLDQIDGVESIPSEWLLNPEQESLIVYLLANRNNGHYPSISSYAEKTKERQSSISLMIKKIIERIENGFNTNILLDDCNNPIERNHLTLINLLNSLQINSLESIKWASGIYKFSKQEELLISYIIQTSESKYLAYETIVYQIDQLWLTLKNIKSHVSNIIAKIRRVNEA